MTNLAARLEYLAQSLVLRERRCPACAAPDATLAARKHAVCRIRHCPRCGLYFTDPIYRSRLRRCIYDGLYRGDGSTTELPDPDRLAALRRSNFRGSDKDFSDRLPRLRRALPGRRLVELGSSWGYFLWQARAAGFEVSGVEIADRRREFAGREFGLPMFPSLAALPAAAFDGLYSAHVLEHFTDLRGVFPAMQRCLVPGGRLILEVPHFDLRGRGSRVLPRMGAVHPLGFTPEFFAAALPPCGLRLLGFYDSWEEFPERPRARSRGDIVLCLAERTAP